MREGGGPTSARLSVEGLQWMLRWRDVGKSKAPTHPPVSHLVPHLRGPRGGRAKLDSPIGDTAPRHTTRRSMHDAQKTKTQPPVSYTHLRAHETRHDLVC